MEARSMNFVIAAYVLTWVCLITYATYVHATLRRARDEYQRASRHTAGEQS